MTRGRGIPDPAATAARLVRRRRAERRMENWGRLAVALPAAMLLLLFLSVCGRAFHAFTEHHLVIDLELPDAAVAAGDFGGLAERGLRAAFPEAEGRRAQRRVYGLVSDEAGRDLEAALAAAPFPRPRILPVTFLASDDADLYLKGLLFPPERHPGAMEVALSGVGGEYLLTPTGPGSFEEVLVPFREALKAVAVRREAEAGRQRRGAEVFAGRAESEPDSAARSAMQEKMRVRSEKAEALSAEAEALRQRAARRDLAVETSEEWPSVLVVIAGGVLKATGISAGRIDAVAVREPSGPGHFAAEEWSLLLHSEPEKRRSLADDQIGWLEWLRAAGRTESRANWRLFTAGDSREAELAGIRGALLGTAWTLLVTFLLAFPLGVLAALYLEEFAPRNRFTSLVEVNINNLGAVPSIVFGLLGLAVFLQFFGLPRSAPVVGGMTLALMTLPVVIISGRASIRAVPPSIRDAAYGVGATQVQTAFHHVLPAAMPGIVTGAVLGLARALGETAPLLLIGMVAFIADSPEGPFDPAAALPALIFQWAQFPEPAFQNRAAAAILILVLSLAILIAAAGYMRRRFERRW